MGNGNPVEGFGLLSVLIFAPLVAAGVAAVLKGDGVLRWWTLVTTVCVGVASVALLPAYQAGQVGFQLVERMRWIPSLGVEYRLGVDGISVLLILLTTGLAPLCVLGSWRYIGTRVKEFMICLLVMESAMVGVFCALDFVLFFMFWEAMLIPMSLMIGVWGGGRRVYAAVKFFVYTMAGSALMLAAIVALRLQTGTFGIPEMMGRSYSNEFQCWVFGAFLLSFAIKVPMLPFHTWLPAAHVEAPTAGSVLLAGVLLKMGTYGFLRFSLPITPYAAREFAPWLAWISVAAILYGGLAALAQTDLKKLVAYSSVGHMGFATLGIFSLTREGLEGATLVMINHGVTTGALFLVVGMLYERLHTREIGKLAGLGKRMPWMAGCLGVFCLSSMAFPGTNSFVGEFLVMAGGFSVGPVMMLFAVPGVVAAAAYNLRMLQKVAYGGTDNPDHSGVQDLNARECVTLLPLVALVLVLGLHPEPVLDLMRTSVQHLLGQVQPGGGLTLVVE